MTRLLSLIGGLSLLCLIGCLSGSNDAPRQSSSNGTNSDGPTAADVNNRATKLDAVELALNWFPEAEHGGFFAAEVQGLFAERGLRVKLVSGGPGVPVIQNVASGKVLFGVTNADLVLLGRAQEADVVAVFAPIQQSPRCVMVHKKSGITKFEELKDMTLAINPNQTFLGFLKKRLSLTNVRILPYSGSVAPFLQDDGLGQQAYVFSEPFTAEKQGGDPHNLMVSDLGFNPYTSVLITRGEVIRQNPDLVKRMVEACALGWRKYLDAPASANELIHSRTPEMDLDVLEFGAKTLKPLCETGLSAPERLGEMTAERWQTLTEQLIEAEALKPGSVDPTKAFDTTFFPK